MTLKMTKKLSSTSSAGGSDRQAALVGSEPDHTMTFDLKDMADLQIPSFAAPQTSKAVNGMSQLSPAASLKLTSPGTASRFQTDTDISGNQNRAERKLQKWVPDAADTTDFSLESGKTGDWDQFKANQQLFGTQSSYDESYYTTHIDRSSESYRAREARAHKLAREIEASQSNNQHVREERGQSSQHEADDEEAKYSGVRRDQAAFPPLASGGADKYTPPARRPPTGAPTVAGAPYDSAIVSAQLSRPDNKSAVPPQPRQPSPLSGEQTQQAATVAEASQSEATSTSPNPDKPDQSQSSDTQTEGVTNRLLVDFKHFADAEKQKVYEKKRAQATEEKRAKLNELLQFSQSFKLKTVVPSDLVGILAKDPAKQEAIVRKSQKDVEVPAVPPQSQPAKETTIRKSDIAQIPPFQGGRGRGGLPPSASMRLPQQSNMPVRNGPGAPRTGKASQPQAVPAPIPLVDPRGTSGVMGESGLTSPSRSNIHTPMSAASSAKFNLNVRAMEFKPTAAPFNPTGSNAPSSPSSVARASSVSRAASPSAFFGSRKPKSPSQRPSISASFQTIKKLKQDQADLMAKSKKDGSVFKDYSSTGGIAPAYLTQPRWQVSQDNAEKTYQMAFERSTTASPAVSRTGSAQAVPYHQHMPNAQGGPNVAGMSGPQHMPPNYGQGYDEQRMPMMQPQGQTFASPSFQSRQPSYASPMAHPAQLAYGQQPYFGGGQMPMQMRQFPGTPHNQGTAPMMMQQQSSGPYMNMPQQFNNQMGMYSPSPGHVYSQQNGYGSPGRAPMMMQQGSQQGHGQPMMWSASAQGGPMYGQQAQMNMYRGYQQQQYGSSPQQPYPGQQQRAGSYGHMPHHKMMHMQHAGMGQDEGK